MYRRVILLCLNRRLVILCLTTVSVKLFLYMPLPDNANEQIGMQLMTVNHN